MMFQASAFNSSEGEATFLAAYDHEMKLWSRLIPDFERELVPGCRHDMCSSQHQIVNVRVLEIPEEDAK